MGNSVELPELASVLPDLDGEEPFDDPVNFESIKHSGVEPANSVALSFKNSGNSTFTSKRVFGQTSSHPILRPREHGSDYQTAEFVTRITGNRTTGSVAIRITATFHLSDPCLLELVENQAAEHVLLVKSTRTRFRKAYRSFEPRIDTEFRGELSERVVLSSFLVCCDEQIGFTAHDWVQQFSGVSFDLQPGDILAVDKSKECWIGVSHEGFTRSIFAHEQTHCMDGQWKCNMENHRILIQMSESDSMRFLRARKQIKNSSDIQYLTNGLYLPVLIHVLNAADRNPYAYTKYSWFTSLDGRLRDLGCRPLGALHACRATDAQLVMEHPFTRMPLLA